MIRMLSMSVIVSTVKVGRIDVNININFDGPTVYLQCLLCDEKA